MADRKQFKNVPAPDPELVRLLKETGNRPVGEEELREQRVSFAFGNALGSDSITKESVRHAARNLKLTDCFRAAAPNGGPQFDPRGNLEWPGAAYAGFACTGFDLTRPVIHHSFPQSRALKSPTPQSALPFCFLALKPRSFERVRNS